MAITASRLLRFNRQFERIYAAQFAPFLARTGLCMQEAQVLLFLENNPELDTARDVAEYRGLAKSQVSQAVEQLSARGFLHRTPDESDRRIVHLAVTEGALPLAKEARAVQRHCGTITLQGLTRQERETLTALLEKVFVNVERLTEKETCDL